MKGAVNISKSFKFYSIFNIPPDILIDAHIVSRGSSEDSSR